MASKRIVALWALFLIAVVAALCLFEFLMYQGITAPVKGSIKISNHSGTNSVIRSGDAGQTVPIPKNGIASLSHVYGPIDVLQNGHRVWHYKDVIVGSFGSRSEKTWISHHLWLDLELKTNGLFVLLADGSSAAVTNGMFYPEADLARRRETKQE